MEHKDISAFSGGEKEIAHALCSHRADPWSRVEINGKRAKELGVCPAVTAMKVNGANDGINAGRVCWAIAGTLCGGHVQGSYAQKLGNCLNCNFFAYVRDGQGDNFVNSKEILKILAQ